jgi:hypothetical protein
LLNNKGIAPGVTVSVTSLDQALNGAFPHRTEDTPIDPVSVQISQQGPPAWFGQGAPPTAATLQDAFEGNIQHSSVWNGRLQSIYVSANTNTRSLWGVTVDRAQLELVKDYDKLKAHLSDGQQTYVVSVSSRVLKEALRAGGLAGASAVLPANGPLHVRVGLARPWHAHPDKCYAMINGVHW